MARLFYTPAPDSKVHRVVRHQPTWTILNNLRKSRDELMNKIARHTRHEIRMARKLGDRIRVERNGENAARSFLAVYNDFARSKDGVWPISQAVLDRYSNYADIVVAYLDQEPAVVNLLLRDPEAARVREMLTASKRLQVDDKKTYRTMGNLSRLMHWENMCFYKEAGFEMYDWGGIRESNDNDGITEYKMSFGGDTVKENTYLCAGSPAVGKLVLALFENFSKRGRYGKNHLAASNGG
ncbi:MAG: hypothetical protein ACREP6_14950 [Candidatus Binataceae bacterium]